MAENGFSRFGVLASFLVALLTILTVAEAATLPNLQSLQQDRVPGELIVMYRDKARSVTLLQKKVAISAVRTVHGDPRVQIIRLSEDSQMMTAMQSLAENPEVMIVEPNYLYSVQDAKPNDALFGMLWGLENTGQKEIDKDGNEGQAGTPGSDVGILPVWEKGITGSHDVRVAIVDTGIDWEHSDLKENLWTNPGEAGDLAKNGIDDDGNGYVDDVHGFNFITDSSNSQDDQSHGTHCAGTIGAVGNNGSGVVGVNWKVSLVPVKVFDKNGITSAANLYEGVVYATKLGVNIMSNSWGGRSASDVLKKAIEDARDQGILFVAAAGNTGGNNDSRPFYPASYDVDNIISVAANDNQDNLAKFSAYGASSVDVAAPGVSVYSTIPGGQYKHKNGTSMATPHVSGIAALMLSHEPTLTYAQIKERLIRTSTPVAGLRTKVVAKGRVNAWNAVMDITPESTEPRDSDWKTRDVVIESLHPYKSDTNQVFTITEPGATRVRVRFKKIGVENLFDFVIIEDSSGNVKERFTGQETDLTTDYIEGDTLNIRFRSDKRTNGFGFLVDRVQFTE